MHTRQLTNPSPIPPSSDSSAGSSTPARYKQGHKVYYMPPPRAPTSTFQHGRPRPTNPVPIYSHTNNSYSPNAPAVAHSPPQKHSHPFISSSSRARSNSNSSSTSTLVGASSRSRSQSPSRGEEDLSKAPGVPTSRYIHMLLSLDTISKLYNLLAAFSTWILLAGYVLLPGTFVSLQNLPDDPPPSVDPASAEKPDAAETIKRWLLTQIRNTPLLYLATFCTAVGALGMLALWFRWRKNYVWIINRIFIPGTLNSLAGVISTVVNVQTAQDGKWSLTAVVSVTVTAVSTVVNGTLWVVYSQWALRKVQEMHARDYFGGYPGDGDVEKGKDGKERKGKMELGESGELVEVQGGRD